MDVTLSKLLKKCGQGANFRDSASVSTWREETREKSRTGNLRVDRYKQDYQRCFAISGESCCKAKWFSHCSVSRIFVAVS